MSQYQSMGPLFDLSGGAEYRRNTVTDKSTAAPPTQDICENRHRGNPNSEEAFHAIKDRLTEQQNRVLKCLRDRPEGLIAEEIATILGCTVNEISGRCSELKRMGKVRTNGRRLTRGGNPASVLVIA